jgi:hypothetical protein
MGAILAAIGALFSRLFFSKLGSWIAAAAVFLGLELITYSVAVEPLRDEVISKVLGIPEGIRVWMGVLRLDQYITVIFSAYAAAIVKKTLLRRRTS